MDKFTEIVNQLKVGVVIDFKEYVIDRRERKKLALSLEYVTIAEVFPANQTINRQDLERIYGPDLDDLHYLILSTNNCPRYLLNIGINPNGEMDVKMVTLNRDFVNLGYQEITLQGNLDVSAPEPNYMIMMKGM